MRLAASAVALVFAFAAQPAFAKPKAKSKDKNIKQASYNPSESSATYGMSSTKTETSTSPLTSPEVRLMLGTTYGFNFLVEDGSSSLVGVDTIFKLTPKAFIPVGVSRWNGDLNERTLGSLVDGTMTMTVVDFGMGYRAHLTPKTYIPVGARFGWYEMNIKGDELGVPFSFDSYGRCITPFSGFTTSISRRVSLGYDMKLPLCFSSDKSSDDDEEEDDDDSKSNSVLSYHAFAVTFSL